MALARDRIWLPATVITGASTNWTPVTGLAFPALASRCYHVRAVLLYTVAAATTGLRLGLSANPTTAPTAAGAMDLGPDGIGTVDGGGHDDYVTTGNTTGGATAKANSPDTTGGNVHTWEALVIPSAAQILQLEAGPEAAAAVTILRGYLEWELDPR